MSSLPRAFYARKGSTTADIITILHPPYTIWHLSYVALGAALAPTVGTLRLAGTLLAFLAGLGVGAHALDELHDRPLRTALSDRSLWRLGIGGLTASGAIAVAGVFVISPWVLLWAIVGISLALAYPLEWSGIVHSDPGFALAWGAFPVLVGYWAQAETISNGAWLMAGAATALSLLQRHLSRTARLMRRNPPDAMAQEERHRRLRAAERPLKVLSAMVPVVAIAALMT